MAREVRIGGLDRTAFFAEDLALPILEEVDAIGYVSDALDQAATERKGVAVVGAKGAGKSVAVKRALDDFDSAERAAQKADAGHERRRVVTVHSPRSKVRREIVSVIWKAVLGMELRALVRGRAKPDDLIIEELVEHMLQQRVAVLVFDEAEFLSDEGLRVIRDLISISEASSKERYSADDYRPAGVGALLIGTPDLESRLSTSDEAGHRWIRIQRVDGLDAGRAAGVYVQFLPGIKKHVEQVGLSKWVEFVRLEIARGHHVPIRLIENHVRNYARRMSAENPKLKKVEQIEFDEELFLFTLGELARQRDGNGR